MKPLFILSVAAALFAACGSDGDNAVTQPAPCECNRESMLETSSSLDMGGNSSISSNSNVLMSSSSVFMLSDFSVVSPESVVRGKITDSRDGKTYKTVTIGSQTWMAENLNYETELSYCYNNSIDSCAKYGRHYTWDAAMNACPDGWHLPEAYEWYILYLAVDKDPNAMQATGWTKWRFATDAYGFSALPAGTYYKGFNYDKGFNGVGDNQTFFWSATEYLVGQAVLFNLWDDVNPEDIFYKDRGFSVRCLKDGP